MCLLVSLWSCHYRHTCRFISSTIHTCSLLCMTPWYLAYSTLWVWEKWMVKWNTYCESLHVYLYVPSSVESNSYVIHLGTMVLGTHGTLLVHVNSLTIRFQINRIENALFFLIMSNYIYHILQDSFYVLHTCCLII